MDKASPFLLFKEYCKYPNTNKKGANSSSALAREEEERYAQKEIMVANLIREF